MSAESFCQSDCFGVAPSCPDPVALGGTAVALVHVLQGLTLKPWAALSIGARSVWTPLTSSLLTRLRVMGETSQVLKENPTLVSRDSSTRRRARVWQTVFSRNCHSASKSQGPLFTSEGWGRGPGGQRGAGPREPLGSSVQKLCRKPWFTPQGGHIPEHCSLGTSLFFFFHKRLCSCACGVACPGGRTGFASPGARARGQSK